MRSTFIRAFTLMTLAMPLGACSSFGINGFHFAHHSPKAPVMAGQAATALGARETEAGRGYLAVGQPGLAIEAFQRALASGEPIAPAANGMGVAYARLGRYDLAQRFFAEAMAADPANTRYAENMTRLARSPTFALRGDAGADVAAATEETVAKPAEKVAPRPGAIERVSRSEVRITTLPPQAAPLHPRTAAIDRRFKPIVQISLGDEKPLSVDRFRPIVRISLGPSQPLQKPASAASRRAAGARAASTQLASR